MPDSDAQPADAQRAAAAAPQEPTGLRCDFCGEPAATVRRIALDGDYERLRKPHREQYACPPCSAAKERQRGAAPPADG